MLQNAYFLAKIGADAAENEQHFAEILPKTGTDGAIDWRADLIGEPTEVQSSRVHRDLWWPTETTWTQAHVAAFFASFLTAGRQNVARVKF